MKIAGTVILYYPDENVIQNILSYGGMFEKLYIVDNSETVSESIKEKAERLVNAVYLGDGKNNGIAARLNQVSFLAIEEGFEWLLTMDQDSSFEGETFINYLKCIHTFDEKEKVSMFGVNFEKNETGLELCSGIKVNHLITSGSFLNLKILTKIGGFDENLFIDEVDFEYCLRSVLKGFNLIQFTNIFLQHNLGVTSFHRSFKTAKTTTRVLHSPVRLYYMTRNFLYVRQKYYKSFPHIIKERKNILLNRIKNNILYNKHRLNVIKNVAIGFEDFRKKQMGKLK